jgi:hypothetical protein
MRSLWNTHRASGTETQELALQKEQSRSMLSLQGERKASTVSSTCHGSMTDDTIAALIALLIADGRATSKHAGLAH